MTKQPTSIADLHPDKRNRRKHNPRNLGMIEKSLNQVGAARSIVIDEDNNILAGNGTIEAAAAAGIERLQVVDSDGETIIAVRRSGLSDDQKRKLAMYDNRTAELSEWDLEQLLEDIKAGEDLGDFFKDYEVNKLLNIAANPVDYAEEWQGMPEFESEDKQGIIVRVHFLNDDDRAEFFGKLGVKFTADTKSFWYPERPQELRNQLGTGMEYTESGP